MIEYKIVTVYLEPDKLKVMVDSIRNIKLALGATVKKLRNSEKSSMKIVRKSIVVKTDINKGDILTEENITIKRPGNGINPMRWDKTIGTVSQKDYSEDKLI